MPEMATPIDVCEGVVGMMLPPSACRRSGTAGDGSGGHHRPDHRRPGGDTGARKPCSSPGLATSSDQRRGSAPVAWAGLGPRGQHRLPDQRGGGAALAALWWRCRPQPHRELLYHGNEAAVERGAFAAEKRARRAGAYDVYPAALRPGDRVSPAGWARG